MAANMRSISTTAAPASPGILGRLIASQKYLSAAFDRMLPRDYRVDGCKDFDNFARPYLARASVLWDVGGGRFPFLSRELKSELLLTTVGFDISAAELDAAPSGIYDRKVAADILTYQGQGEADIVVCQSLLEHVSDVEAALVSIRSMLKPGGLALVFLPSRNAVYTKINAIIPEDLKSRLLRLLVHGRSDFKAFPAYYDRCTPRSIRSIAERSGLEVADGKNYFISEYFTFLFPLHLIWRLWLIVFRCFAGDEASETFALALRRRSQ
jgi:SAM-dependent methyltransferase